jgi:integrase
MITETQQRYGDALDILERVMADSSTRMKLSHGTIRQYKKHLTPFLHWLPSPDGTFTYEEVERYFQTFERRFMRDNGRAPTPGYMNGIKASVLSYIKHGTRIGALPPEMRTIGAKIVLAKKGTVLKGQRRKVKLSYEEYMLLRREADDFHALIFWTLWETIRRPGEVLGLPWADIDFDGNRIYFRETKGDNPGWAMISSALSKALREWKEHQQSGNMVVSRRKCPPSEWAFSVYEGRPLRVDTLTKYIQRLAARLNFEKIPTSHAFRGSAATYAYFVKKVPMKLIADQGGYRGTATLETRYIHDDPEARRAWMEESEPEETTPEAPAKGGIDPEVIEAISKLAPEAQKAAIERLFG